MDRRNFIKLFGCGVGAFSLGCASRMSIVAEVTTQKANIVLIYADDLGYNGIGCYGNKLVETPNIDKLCSEGMKFTDGYSNGPTCAPSRAALISGQYAPRTHIYRVGDRFAGKEQYLKYLPPAQAKGLALEKITIGEAVKKGGYATTHLGKWHLGYAEKYHPVHQGFDFVYESHGRHYEFTTVPPVENIPKETYLADWLTDRCLEFIDKSLVEKKPFFVYLPHFSIHGSMHPPVYKEEYIEHFKKTLPADTDPKYLMWCAMTKSLDDSVGRIMAKLENEGLDENTLVIFTSDNGGVKSDGNLFNSPLRDGKGSVYEGGIRVPYIFRWKGRIKPGTICTEPITGIDLYPTCVEAAGLIPDPDYPLDGVSLMPCLFSEGRASLARDAIFWFYPKYAGYSKKTKTWSAAWRNVIRMRDFKLIEYPDTGKIELYNLRKDIQETQDLSEAMPEKAQELLGRLNKWKKEIGVQEIKLNPDYSED